MKIQTDEQKDENYIPLGINAGGIKIKDLRANTVDPDETAHYEPSHLDLQCLPIQL